MSVLAKNVEMKHIEDLEDLINDFDYPQYNTELTKLYWKDLIIATARVVLDLAEEKKK